MPKRGLRTWNHCDVPRRCMRTWNCCRMPKRCLRPCGAVGMSKCQTSCMHVKSGGLRRGYWRLSQAGDQSRLLCAPAQDTYLLATQQEVTLSAELAAAQAALAEGKAAGSTDTPTGTSGLMRRRLFCHRCCLWHALPVLQHSSCLALPLCRAAVALGSCTASVLHGPSLACTASVQHSSFRVCSWREVSINAACIGRSPTDNMLVAMGRWMDEAIPLVPNRYASLPAAGNSPAAQPARPLFLMLLLSFWHSCQLPLPRCPPPCMQKDSSVFGQSCVQPLPSALSDACR
jgi:hypothetical protein